MCFLDLVVGFVFNAGKVLVDRRKMIVSVSAITQNSLILSNM
jgi:hypothetical protein